MTNLYLSDVVFSPAQRRFDDYINDKSAHPISGVLFVSIRFSAIYRLFDLAPEGVLFVFRGRHPGYKL